LEKTSEKPPSMPSPGIGWDGMWICRLKKQSNNF
jgi:hypothetical protein